MIKYTNGTYQVTQLKDGTKILDDPSGKFEADFPDNLDIKITDYCDVGCKFCYEDSGKSGKHCDHVELVNRLSELPGGIEIALGGGNPLSHPEIEYIIEKLSKDQGKLVSMTVNQKSIDLDKIISCVNSGLRALGVSPKPGKHESILELDSFIKIPIVYHMILGIHSPEQIEKYLLSGKKVLILGYKCFGRAVNQKPEISEWIPAVKRIKHRLSSQDYYPDIAGLSFDNLAIRQLNLRSSFTTADWEIFYLGEDGSKSMYIDAVEGTYSESSTVSKISRTSWNDCGILKFFKHDNTGI